jgi:predicted N-acetyltransferase YhbS
MQVKIKRFKKRDFEEIEMLLKVAFDRDSVAIIIKELIETADFIPELTRVARISGQIIGVIVYSHAQIIKGKKIHQTISMAPMAVLPAYQNLGIGGELIRNSFAKARELEYQSVIVMGHEEYYPRFGFKLASEFGIIPPFDVPDENFMVLELFPDTLSGISGKVKYHPLFDDMPSFTI